MLFRSIFILVMSVLAVIITKGGNRVSEIAARFALDSMSVKMMAIETELGAGAITEEEAALKKQKVHQDSDILCSMDGASKFVTGSLKLIIILPVIIIIAGILIEIFFRDSPIVDPISLYLGFSAGTGFFFMLSLMILSTVMGIVVARVVR